MAASQFRYRPEEDNWTPQDTFAARLRALRFEVDTSSEAAALAIGVSPATWSAWERGARPKDMLSVIEKIAEAFGCDPVWLHKGRNT